MISELPRSVVILTLDINNTRSERLTPSGQRIHRYHDILCSHAIIPRHDRKERERLWQPSPGLRARRG